MSNSDQFEHDSEHVAPIRKGRLQRGPNAAGYRVSTFRDVISRHGGTMGAIALVGILLPGSLLLVQATTSPAQATPLPYVYGLLGLLVFFALWSSRRKIAPARQLQWVAYLLFISFVEELSFRLILPTLLAQLQGPLVAHILSNLIFAAIHYVTLRWQFKNCVVTFLGGMGLSQLMSGGDLVLVVMVHWLGTFLNTPYPPKKVLGNSS